MRIKIHRGTHEIGGSCVEIKSQGSRIIVDIGIPLVEPNGRRFDFRKYEHLSTTELIRKKILPDIAGAYEWDKDSKRVDGLFISHAHLDHYGFYRCLRKDIPCYLGEGTKRIIDLNTIFLGGTCVIGQPTFLKSGSAVVVGQIKVTPYLVDHSAFDSYAFLIESNDRKVLYSGDFREHGRKSKAFYWFLRQVPERIDALLLEGSQIGRGSELQQTEENIEHRIIQTIEDSNNITFCVLSAQNIDRVVSFYKATLRTRRQFIVDVYTANILNNLKDLANIPYPSEKFKNMKVFFPYRLCNKLAKEGKYELMYKFRPYKISKKEVSENAHNTVMMVRPSMLSDLSRIDGIEGGTIIYSMWEGYLKEKSMERFLDFTKKKHMQLFFIHTSGHARIDTLKKVVDRVKPKKIIPIHTFYPDRYTELFQNVLSVTDGMELNI